jgi:hypothetical protein
MQGNEVRYISSKDQLADVMTKALSRAPFIRNCNNLNITTLVVIEGHC